MARTFLKLTMGSLVARAMVFVACFVALLAVTSLNAATAENPKPNIVVILADDMGYGDPHCYNPERGKIATPHIDRLAEQGMRFTDAHSSSGVCSPSRYTLLTGRYHWRTRLQNGIVNYLEPPLIAPERLTIAKLAASQGYRTACIGKWHLGWEWDIPKDERALFAPDWNERQTTDRHREVWKARYSRPIEGGPTARGFETYFGVDLPNWPPYCFIENNRTRGIPTQLLPPEYFTPLFDTMPGPALANWKFEDILPTVADKAEKYIADRTKEGEPFLLYLPLTAPHTPVAVTEPWRGKSGLESEIADYIMETDDVVGRVMTAIRSSGIDDRTLVIFTSDNGFASYVGMQHLEQRGHYPSGPLRGSKGDVWEGGHRMPFIVQWKGVVKPGTVCDQLAHHADVMATLAEILQTKLPKDAGEDSFSLLPLLQGSQKPVREYAVSNGTTGMAGLRVGSWKLIFGPGGAGPWSGDVKKETYPAQLYNLTEDIGEKTNLYSEHPERVQKMTELMKQLVEKGRSNEGPAQSNDVPVQWNQVTEWKEKAEAP